jgi:hypothetical protein
MRSWTCSCWSFLEVGIGREWGLFEMVEVSSEGGRRSFGHEVVDLFLLVFFGGRHWTRVGAV